MNGFLHQQELTTIIQASLNAALNVLQTTTGQVRSALRRPNRQIAQIFLRMLFGTQYQVSLRLGMERNGSLLQTEHTTRQQATVNAGLSAKPTIRGTAFYALLMKKMLLHAQANLRTRYGTAFRLSLKHGTELNGFLQLQQYSAKLQAQLNAVSNVPTISTGTDCNAHSAQETCHAQDFQKMLSGIMLQKSRRLGTEMNGFRQISVLSTLPQALLNVTSNATNITLGTTLYAKLTLSRQPAPDCRNMQSGTVFQI